MCRAARMAEWKRSRTVDLLNTMRFPRGSHRARPCVNVRNTSGSTFAATTAADGRVPENPPRSAVRLSEEEMIPEREDVPIADDLASVVDRVGPGAPIDVQRAEVADASVLPDHGS